MSHRYWLLALGLLMLGSLAWAQTTQPAPATRPSVGGIPDPNVIAVGDWSQAVNDLVGRLVVANVDGTGRETVTYLELQPVTSQAHRLGSVMSVYVDDIVNIKCEMRDGGGKLVPVDPSIPGFVGGNIPPPPAAVWVVLPSDCTMRLRISGHGRVAKDGLCIGVGWDEWNLKFNAPGEYTCNATFASDPPKDGGHPEAWSGTIKLPPLKISVKEPAK